VPEQVAQSGSQSLSLISVFISVVVPVPLRSSDATASPLTEIISILNEPVFPIVEGFCKRPKLRPNCPEFLASGKSPSTVIIVLPEASVPTIHVNPILESNKSAQVFNAVEPPEFVDDMVTSRGKVITTIESFGIVVSAVKITS